MGNYYSFAGDSFVAAEAEGGLSERGYSELGSSPSFGPRGKKIRPTVFSVVSFEYSGPELFELGKEIVEDNFDIVTLPGCPALAGGNSVDPSRVHVLLLNKEEAPGVHPKNHRVIFKNRHSDDRTAWRRMITQRYKVKEITKEEWNRAKYVIMALIPYTDVITLRLFLPRAEENRLQMFANLAGDFRVPVSWV